MIVSNDTGHLDMGKFLDYIQNNLSSDVAQLVSVRDELALRQGALSAVNDAVKIKTDAEEYARIKIEDANGLFVKATAQSADADIYAAKLTALEVALNAREEEINKDLAAREKQLNVLAATLAVKEATLNDKQIILDNDNADLSAARDVLNARIQAFQDKVASISI